MNETKNIRYGLSVVLTASLFYLFMFYIRVMPSVLTNELMHAFSTGSAGISLVTAAFVYGYAMIQIPSGIIIDRYGCKKALTFNMLTCAIAIWIFQASTNVQSAAIARGLMGMACGTAFIGPLTLAREWLPKNYFSPVAGVIQLLGCLGAMFSGPPVIYFASRIGWQDTIAQTALIAFMLTALFYIFIPKDPKVTKTTTPPSTIKNLKYLVSTPRYWLIGMIAMASWAPIGGFAELWGISFLQKLQSISIEQATQQMLWVWIGVAVSSPLAGIWAEKCQSDMIPVISCYTFGLLATALIISGYITDPTIINALLFILGMTAGGQPVAFGLINKLSKADILATAVGFCNICVISGAFVMQPVIGYLLEYNWDNVVQNGSPVYQISNYQHAFTPILLIVILGIVSSIALNSIVKIKEEKDDSSSGGQAL